MKIPHLNGYEATIEIRQLNKNAIIIAQSDFSLSFDKQKVIDADCDDYISKPNSMNKLITLIRKYFE